MGARTEPGTAPTFLPSSMAARAVDRAPERIPASTTTVEPDQAAMSRLRARKRHFAGRHDGGASETTAPPASMTARKSSAWARG